VAHNPKVEVSVLANVTPTQGVTALPMVQ